MAVAFKKYRFTAEQFMQMGPAGVLSRDQRFELIDGDVLEMPPQNPPHASAVDTIADVLRERFRKRAIIRVQGPLWLDNTNMPEPDVLLLAHRRDRYSKFHPDPQSVYLAVEVADSSLRYDREVKAPLYASKGVKELWIVDVGTRQVEMYKAPTLEGYRYRLTQPIGTEVWMDAFPDDRIEVAAFFESDERGDSAT